MKENLPRGGIKIVYSSWSYRLGAPQTSVSGDGGCLIRWKPPPPEVSIFIFKSINIKMCQEVFLNPFLELWRVWNQPLLAITPRFTRTWCFNYYILLFSLGLICDFVRKEYLLIVSFFRLKIFFLYWITLIITRLILLSLGCFILIWSASKICNFSLLFYFTDTIHASFFLFE